jgi:UbiD family decarboxylase
MHDLRDWLAKLESMDEVKTIKGLHWDLEIGATIDPSVLGDDPHAFLFDDIVDYPGGYRILSGSIKTPRRTALCLGMPLSDSISELIQVAREKIPQWEARLPESDPQVVQTGPVLENIDSGKDVNLFKFPVPKWHELDGGRYIGTADAIITRDPDTGEVNLGTYRIMVHDDKTAALYISPGKHSRIHYEKYHARGEACPVAISVGHHPLIFAIASSRVSGDEYNHIGAISGDPVSIIKEELTGLPIPADAEIVLVGWCPPGKTRTEGPFGEWTGYYGSGERPAPILEVERVYYRNNPIILGAPPRRPPTDNSIFQTILGSAMLHDQLEKAGVPDVRGFWVSHLAGSQLIVVSIKQRYAGHARQAAFAASQGSRTAAYFGRYVIVVDEDIDPTNIEEVLWALCTRSDPEKDIDIIRRAWSTPLDPTIRKPTKAFMNSRGIIDACRPYEWIDEFPAVVEVSPELRAKMRRKLQMTT